MGNTFEVRGKGKNILLGKLGKKFDIYGNPLLGNEGIKVFEETGISSLIPKENYFGILNIPETPRELRNVRRNLKRQLKNPTLGGDIAIDIRAPIGQRNLYFELNKNVGLSLNPRERRVFINAQENKRLLGFQGKGIKSSEEFFNELYKDEGQATKQVSKASKASKENPKINLNLQKISSELLSETKVKIPSSSTPSMYAGLGLYERTNEMGSVLQSKITNPRQSLIQQSIQKPESIFKSGLSFGERSIHKNVQILKPVELNLNKLAPIELLKPKLETKIQTKQVPIQKLRYEQVLNKISKQVSKQVPIQRLGNVENQVPIRPIFKKPKTNVYTQAIKQIVKNQYEIFKNVKGKETKIATTFGLEKASKKLKKGLFKDLSASGFVVNVKTGKKVKASELINFIGEGFRKSKYKKGVVVQKLNKRLTTGTERKNIQKERKGKFFFGGKKNAKFKFF